MDTGRTFKAYELYFQLGDSSGLDFYKLHEHSDFYNIMRQLKLLNEDKLERLEISQPIPQDNHLKSTKTLVFNNF